MKWGILYTCSLLICSLSLVAQQTKVPTREEMEKMIAEQKEKANKILAGIDTNKYKQLAKSQTTGAGKGKPSQNNYQSLPNMPVTAPVAGVRTSISLTMPARNNTLLAALPKKLYSKEEFASYCFWVNNELIKKLSPAAVGNYNAMKKQAGSNVKKLMSTATLLWMEGSIEEALLLASEAVMLDPGNSLHVNNFAAMLNMAGGEIKAIPFLQELVQRMPDNATALNNLGQAYAGLGAKEEAMMFFGRCIQMEAHHPQANQCGGIIEASKGNTGAAIASFENSLKGSLSTNTISAIRKLDPKKSIGKIFRPHVQYPEYFNENKYKVPEQCTNVYEAHKLNDVYFSFHRMISRVKRKFEIIRNEAREKAKLAEQERMKKVLALQPWKVPPYAVMAAFVLDDIRVEMQADLEILTRYDIKYREEMGEYGKEYEEKLKAIEGNLSQEEMCRRKDEIANAYMAKAALRTIDWQKKHIIFEKKYINELIYWSRLISFDEYIFLESFCKIVDDYLNAVNSIARTIKIAPACDPLNMSIDRGTEEVELKTPECPFDISFDFIAGSFTMNCEGYSISGGQGIQLKYSKKYATGESRFSVGAGVSKKWKMSGGGFETEMGVSASQEIFITLDGKGNVSDVGMKLGISASAGVEVSGSGNLGNEIVKNVTVKKGATVGETELGYTVSMDSGWKFNEGPLKNVLSTPPPVQLNKNVGIYK